MTTLTHGQTTSLTFPDRPGLALGVRRFTKPGVTVTGIESTLLSDTVEQEVPGGLQNVGALRLTVLYDPAQEASLFIDRLVQRCRIGWADGTTQECTGWFKDLTEPTAEKNKLAERDLTLVLVSNLAALTAATPTIVLSGSSASISTSTPGASIRYTTDGSTPTSTVGTVYSGAVTLTSGQTIKAVAYLSGYATSAVASSTYTAAITGYLARDGSSVGYPLFDDTTGFTALTSGQWATGTSPTNQQDFLPFRVPGSSPVQWGAIVGSGLNASGAATSIIRSGTDGLSGWTLVGAYTAFFASENGSCTMGVNAKGAWAHDHLLVEITAHSSTPQIPASIRFSTDGGSSWSTANTAIAALAWSTSGSPVWRTAIDGTMVAALQSFSSAGAEVCGISVDSGTTWTKSTCPGATATVGRDATNSVLVSGSRTFSGSYSQTLTLYSCATVGGSWVSRQTITLAAATANGQDQTGMIRQIGSYLYLPIKIAAGWAIYRAVAGTLAAANPFALVLQTGNTTATPAALSTPKLHSDGKLKFEIAGQKYESADGATWTTSGTAVSNSAGQMAA